MNPDNRATEESSVVASPFGALLRSARVAAKLSQRDVAAALGVTRQAIQAVEAGHRRTLAPGHLPVLATLLSVPLEQLQSAALHSARVRIGRRSATADEIRALSGSQFPSRQYDDNQQVPAAQRLLHATREASTDYDLAACGARLVYLSPGDPENEAPPGTTPTCPVCRALVPR